MGEWAYLVDELLDFILSKLYARDRFNFSLVCRSWKAVAATSTHRNSPCLMFYQRNMRLWKTFQDNSFVYMSFPELYKADICCSKYGWLLMSRNDKTLFFFHPFNSRQTIQIPCSMDYEYTIICFFNPPTSPDCFIVGTETKLDKRTKYEWYTEMRIGLLRYGEGAWKSKIYEIDKKFLVSLSAPVLKDGLLYFTDMKGNIACFDIEKLRCIEYRECLTYRWLRGKIKQHYLFKIKGEEAVYAVFLMHADRSINVFKMLEPEMKWELVKDLGDKMVYLSHASCSGDTPISRRMSNTICFPSFGGDDNNVLFYSLKTRRYHSYSHSLDHSTSTNVKHIFFNATWIMPWASIQEPSTQFTWCPKVDGDDGLKEHNTEELDSKEHNSKNDDDA